mmetsp:Transcript_36720/g.89095  ORF Transcript_36720/g.89095 Transcript_36720/m.89095 type:complete len:87 (-) Transcript_36720:1107-1367(-)
MFCVSGRCDSNQMTLPEPGLAALLSWIFMWKGHCVGSDWVMHLYYKEGLPEWCVPLHVRRKNPMALPTTKPCRIMATIGWIGSFPS